MIQQTSMMAYLEARTKLGKHQEAVYRALGTYGPMCNQELSEVLRWPINSITPRTQELRAKGRVEIDRREVYPPTGRTVIYWRIKDGSE